MAKKSTRSNRELRNLRVQQLIFVLIGIMVILAMVLSLVAK
jgi:predicted nucleic acid-binding Zn ribbon protein